MPKINQKIFRPKRSFVKSVPGAAVGLGPVEVGAPGPPVAIGGAVLTGRRDPIDVVARERALEGPVAVTPVHLEPMLYINQDPILRLLNLQVHMYYTSVVVARAFIYRFIYR
jgi:hypothetical protein